MRLIASAAFLALTFTGLMAAAPATSAPPPLPLPRKSPEFTIMSPAGKQVLISSYKGKVLILPFMFTTCPHCQHEAQMLTKLQNDFGARGLQVLGTVFDDGNGPKAAQFMKDFGIGFPVGYATRDSVISYLSIPIMDRWVVPQVAVIDRKGNIVEQSASTGTPELQDEGYLRMLVEKLLKEPATGGSAAVKKAAPKSN
jgi:peroxiredoxin